MVAGFPHSCIGGANSLPPPLYIYIIISQGIYIYYLVSSHAPWENYIKLEKKDYWTEILAEGLVINLETRLSVVIAALIKMVIAVMLGE